jgi:hypothetical protein
MKIAESSTTPPPASARFPSRYLKPWHQEYATRLHWLCSWIAAGLAGGKKAAPLLRRFARRWNGRRYRCQPDRRFRLSAKSLKRLFQVWRKNGEVPSAFRLAFGSATSRTIEADQIRSFLKMLFHPATTSAHHAYKKLQRRRRHGLRGRAGRTTSYSNFVRHLPPGIFRNIVAARRAIEDAEAAFTKLRFDTETKALASLPPAAPKRTRRNPADEWSI